MRRIDFAQLLSNIVSNQFSKKINIFLCDETIVRSCLENSLFEKNKTKPMVFNDLKNLDSYITYTNSDDLFASNTDSIFYLDQNITEKKWRDQKHVFKNINCGSNCMTFICGPVSCRNYIKEDDFPKDCALIFSYGPSDDEKLKCIDIINSHYKLKLTKQQNQELLEYYCADLSACNEHLKRMQTSGLEFNDAFQTLTTLSAFEVIQSIFENDAGLLDLRLSQYFSSGGEPGGLLGAFSYFLKQLTSFHAAFEKTKNISQAFTLAKIPYPAQDRIKRAQSHMSQEKINLYLLDMCKVELELRQNKDEHSIFLSYFLGVLKPDII